MYSYLCLLFYWLVQLELWQIKVVTVDILEFNETLNIIIFCLKKSLPEDMFTDYREMKGKGEERKEGGG